MAAILTRRDSWRTYGGSLTLSQDKLGPVLRQTELYRLGWRLTQEIWHRAWNRVSTTRPSLANSVCEELWIRATVWVNAQLRPWRDAEAGKPMVMGMLLETETSRGAVRWTLWQWLVGRGDEFSSCMELCVDGQSQQ